MDYPVEFLETDELLRQVHEMSKSLNSSSWKYLVNKELEVNNDLFKDTKKLRETFAESKKMNWIINKIKKNDISFRDYNMCREDWYNYDLSNLDISTKELSEFLEDINNAKNVDNIITQNEDKITLKDITELISKNRNIKTLFLFQLKIKKNVYNL